MITFNTSQLPSGSYSISGSFSGSFQGDGSNLTGLPSAVNTGSLLVTASVSSNVITFTKGNGTTFPITISSSSFALTASYTPNYVLNSATSSFVNNNQTSSFVLNNQTSSMTVLSSSFALTASYISPTFISASAAASGFSIDTTFPYTGSAKISGSLIITGSISAQNSDLSITLANQTSSYNGLSGIGNQIAITQEDIGRGKIGASIGNISAEVFPGLNVFSNNISLRYESGSNGSLGTIELAIGQTDTTQIAGSRITNQFSVISDPGSVLTGDDAELEFIIGDQESDGGSLLRNLALNYNDFGLHSNSANVQIGQLSGSGEKGIRLQTNNYNTFTNTLSSTRIDAADQGYSNQGPRIILQYTEDTNNFTNKEAEHNIGHDTGFGGLVNTLKYQDNAVSTFAGFFTGSENYSNQNNFAKPFTIYNDSSSIYTTNSPALVIEPYINGGSPIPTFRVDFNGDTTVKSLYFNESISGSGDINIAGYTVTGSLQGTASWALNALTASSAPGYLKVGITSSLIFSSQTSSMSVLSSTSSLTASYINPTFISASAAASGFGSGGSSGITVGTTTITSGTSGRIPFNSGSIYGESANLFLANSNTQLCVGAVNASTWQTYANHQFVARNSLGNNFIVGHGAIYNRPYIGFFNDAATAATPWDIFYQGSFTFVDYNYLYSQFRLSWPNGNYLNGWTYIGGTSSPTARLHIAAGTATAGNAPLKLTSGTNLTTPETGAVEYDGTNLFFTPSSTRNIIAQISGSTALSSSQIPFATTNGYLTSTSNLSWDNVNNSLIISSSLITAVRITQTNSGSFVVYSIPTASYDTAFFEYSIKSGSNARAGAIMAIQSGSSVNFTETTTTDFGDTTGVSFTVIVTGSNMALTGSSTAGAWTIKSIVRNL